MKSVKSKVNNSILYYYCSLLILIVFVNILFFINFGDYSVAGQKPSTISTPNFTTPPTTSNMTAPTSTTDAIGITMNSVKSSSLDKLMNQTILPLMNDSASEITATSDNQTSGQREVNQPILTENSSDTIITDTSNNYENQKSTIGDSTNQVNNPIPFTDNQSVLLQFQDPMDADTINKLEEIENMIIEQAGVKNATETVSKSIQESNNKIVQDLSEIKSSISGSSSSSSLKPFNTGGVTAINNLTDRTTSIRESNNKIIEGLSELRSAIGKPSSSSYFLSAVISATVAGAIVSGIAILVFLGAYKTGASIKFNDLRFRRKYR